MKRFLKVLWAVAKFFFVAVFLFVVSLFFREQRIPDVVIERLSEAYVPTGLVAHAESISFGFVHGLHIRNFRLYNKTSAKPLEPFVSVGSISLLPFQRRVVLDRLSCPRLHDGYYEPGNLEKNEPVGIQLPDVSMFTLELIRPDVLALKPERVSAFVSISGNCLSVDGIKLKWPDVEEQTSLEGFCRADFEGQRVYGGVTGFAKQSHIRPFIEALDLQVALPYIDAFTDVRGMVPASCKWSVNLVNNDLDLDLDLHPLLGMYKMVPMKEAEGRIALHVFTRGTSLNYHHVVGPIAAKGPNGEPLDGTVVIDGLNGTNTVSISAKSLLPVAKLLRIGGFEDEYVDDDVVGKTSCDVKFCFPRAMTNNYEVLNGEGHISVIDGQIMRFKGFRGLMALLAEKVPGVSLFTDSTRASCDYTIENGVMKSDNIYIEGSVFSIKMYGAFDAVNGTLDFTARVQFVRNDSFFGKILHPLTWPFTKLLLEFRLTGTADDPEWSYISVIDRVVEVVR